MRRARETRRRPRDSAGSPPVTTLRSTLPPESRSSVDVIRAANVGDMMPGRSATRKRSRSVTAPSRRHDPRVFAGAAGRQQHAVEAQRVGRLRDLAQIRRSRRREPPRVVPRYRPSPWVGRNQRMSMRPLRLRKLRARGGGGVLSWCTARGRLLPWRSSAIRRRLSLEQQSTAALGPTPQEPRPVGRAPSIAHEGCTGHVAMTDRSPSPRRSRGTSRPPPWNATDAGGRRRGNATRFAPVDCSGSSFRRRLGGRGASWTTPSARCAPSRGPTARSRTSSASSTCSSRRFASSEPGAQFEALARATIVGRSPLLGQRAEPARPRARPSTDAGASASCAGEKSFCSGARDADVLVVSAHRRDHGQARRRRHSRRPRGDRSARRLGQHGATPDRQRLGRLPRRPGGGARDPRRARARSAAPSRPCGL